MNYVGYRAQATNYEWLTPFLPSSIQSIVEVGSRDAVDAIFLSNRYKCHVISFEPNPNAFAICERNVEDTQHKQITIRPEALSNVNGEIEFGVVDPECYSNIGASSMFEIDFTNRTKNDPDFGRSPIQTIVVANAARWDSLHLQAPELLVMDCEGAELKVLQGFGSQLREVHFVALEVQSVAIGKGACTFKEVNSFLKHRKFRFVASNTASSKFALYAKLVFVTVGNRLRRPVGKPLRGLSFDALYVRR